MLSGCGRGLPQLAAALGPANRALHAVADAQNRYTARHRPACRLADRVSKSPEHLRQSQAAARKLARQLNRVWTRPNAPHRDRRAEANRQACRRKTRDSEGA